MGVRVDYKGSWALKNWCFWTVVCRRLLRVPWTARRFNQSILKQISPEYSLEGLKLKLKLQYFGQLMWRTDSLEKTWCWERLKARGEGDDRGWDGWMVSPTQWTWVWVSSRSWWWTGKPGVLQSMWSQRVRHDWATELNCIYKIFDSLCSVYLKQENIVNQLYLRKNSYWPTCISSLVMLIVLLNMVATH